MVDCAELHPLLCGEHLHLLQLLLSNALHLKITPQPKVFLSSKPEKQIFW